MDVQREINPRLYRENFMNWLHCEFDVINGGGRESNTPETWIAILNVVGASVHDLGTHPGERLVIVHIGNMITKFAPVHQRTYHDDDGGLNVEFFCEPDESMCSYIHRIYMKNIGTETGWLNSECYTGDRYAVGDRYDGPYLEDIDDKGRHFNKARFHMRTPLMPRTSLKTVYQMDEEIRSDNCSFFDRDNNPVLVVHRISGDSAYRTREPAVVAGSYQPRVPGGAGQGQAAPHAMSHPSRAHCGAACCTMPWHRPGWPLTNT